MGQTYSTSPPPIDHAAMPPSGPRAALFLLPSLLLLCAVLAVPLERGAPKEENPATESPVSGPALLASHVFKWYYSSRSPVAPGWLRMWLGVCLPFFAVPGL